VCGGYRCEFYYAVSNTTDRRGRRSCRKGVSVKKKNHDSDEREHGLGHLGALSFAFFSIFFFLGDLVCASSQDLHAETMHINEGRDKEVG